MPAARSHRHRRSAVALAAVLAVGGSVAVAGSLDRSATVNEQALRIAHPQGELAVAFDIGEVDPFVVAAADRVARRSGGGAALSRTGSLGMRRIERAGTTVHGPPPGWLTPVVFVAVPANAIGRVMGADVPAAVGATSVVMNEITAELTGASVGDRIVVETTGGSPVALTIGGVRPSEQIGWAELVITSDVADRLGHTVDTRVVVYGIDDRAAFDAAVVDEGLAGRTDTKVNRSWDPPDPDDTLSTARAKAVLGEPWYRPVSGGGIEMHPDWRAANLTDGRVLLDDRIAIRARCHVDVIDGLRAALAEVADAGLASEIDVANANSAGGCYVPRYSVQSGFLSRHAYGMAFDTNTLANCFGCRPVMHCDVVRIFRKHGFAWGGNFRRPDGMHFEWVGERRDRIAFASPHCPNVDTGAALVERSGGPPLAPSTLGAGALLAGTGQQPHHDHDHDHDHHDLD